MTSEQFGHAVDTEMILIGEHIIAKNRSYGDSALHPLRVFSRADWRAGLLVRIDDKLSRVAAQQEWPGDDTILDLIGYLVLLRVGQQMEGAE